MLVLVIAFEHIYILYIEMFAWTRKGIKIVPKAEEGFLRTTEAMAANQGLYNGFLAAGLIWAAIIPDVVWSSYIALFFLGCVMLAGIFGALRSSVSILFKQTIPAGIAFFVVLFL